MPVISSSDVMGLTTVIELVIGVPVLAVLIYLGYKFLRRSKPIKPLSGN